MPNSPLDVLAPSTDEPAPQLVTRATKLVTRELGDVEVELKRLLHSSVAVIPNVGAHLADAGGKRFRPLVTLLSARAAGFEGPERIIVAAVSELLHTATLLHDDVIDGGDVRRGRPAARLQYGNGMAVLTGDYCLARGLQAMAATGNLAAVQSMSDTVTAMAEGEVAQLDIAGDWSLDRKRYYSVIERKTATLIAWSCAVANLVEPHYRHPLHRFGLEIGFAFQIADDVIDYQSSESMSGKPRGQDLREGKITLPLIIACERDLGMRARLQSAFSDGPPDEEELACLVEDVAHSEAAEHALDVAASHARQAEVELRALPSSPARDALASLARAVVRRNR
jgi:octaprenyl-diphosphate synthase